jgi:hypothetical protein
MPTVKTRKELRRGAFRGKQAAVIKRRAKMKNK